MMEFTLHVRLGGSVRTAQDVAQLILSNFNVLLDGRQPLERGEAGDLLSEEGPIGRWSVLEAEVAESGNGLPSVAAGPVLVYSARSAELSTDASGKMLVDF